MDDLLDQWLVYVDQFRNCFIAVAPLEESPTEESWEMYELTAHI